MRTQLPSALLATALACSFFTAPAQAQSIRTFVSVAGSDSNPCTITQPCRHFSAAVAATAVGGEVDALDPGAYGSFTISHAITIEGQGWSYVAPPNSGAAITINAGSSDNISIRGVSLNGVGTINSTGIQFNAGGSLNIQNSVIRNFGGDGIDFAPTVQGDLFVSNTLVSGNANTGIAVFPSGGYAHSVTINRVETTDNVSYGVFLWGSPGSGSIAATVFESIVSGSNYGLYALTDVGHSTVKLSVFHSVATRNAWGLRAEGQGATIFTARSMSTGNILPWDAVTSGVVHTYGYNSLLGNTFDS